MSDSQQPEVRRIVPTIVVPVPFNPNKYFQGKGKGISGAKRHRHILRDNKISKPSIRRLARRGGVKRMSADVYADINKVLRIFLEDIIRDTIAYTDHAGRKTVSCLDVVHALKRRNRTIYGFDSAPAAKK